MNTQTRQALQSLFQKTLTEIKDDDKAISLGKEFVQLMDDDSNRSGKHEVSLHDAIGAAEMIAHLVEFKSARDFPPIALDLWIYKIHLFTQVLLGGEPRPGLDDALATADISNQQILRLAVAASTGKFKEATSAFDIEALIIVLETWLKSPETPPVPQISILQNLSIKEMEEIMLTWGHPTEDLWVGFLKADIPNLVSAISQAQISKLVDEKIAYKAKEINHG